MPRKINSDDINSNHYVFFLYGPHRLKIGMLDIKGSTFPDDIKINLVDDRVGIKLTGQKVSTTSRVLRLIEEFEIDKIKRLRNLI